MSCRMYIHCCDKDFLHALGDFRNSFLRALVFCNLLISFNSESFKTSLWTFINPRGDAALTLRGTTPQNRQLSITVPSGTSHDVWAGGNKAPRIMQPANNTDFEVEVKFDSPMNAQFQMEGVLIENNSSDYLRFDFYSDGSNTKIFAASFANGTPSAQANNIIAANGSAPLYMRAKRQGSLWTQTYSFDGKNWNEGANFRRELTVTGVGAFIGNQGNPAPSFTGLIDYFFNTAAPISP